MINPTKFEPEETRVQDIYMFLKNKGYEVYFPAQKVGECTNPYLVVKNNGGNKLDSFSSDADTYSIMVYVPQNRYSDLEVLVMKIKKEMKELRPMIIYNGITSSSFYDDGVKAHMISIDYKNYKKL